MSKPLIDIIVPVYNGAEYLPAFLDRMERQADEAVRFLFVDDGSGDETLRLLREAREERRLPMEVIAREHAGVSAARNAGLDAAEGEYIGFFDVDDTCSEDYTAVLRREAERGGFDALVFLAKSLYDPEEVLPDEADIVSSEAEKADMLRTALLENRAGVYSPLVRRDFVQEMGLRFAEGYPYYEDLDFQYRALGLAEHIRRLDRQLYGYIVMHTGSAMARFTPERVRCLALLKNLEDFFTDHVPEFAPLFRRYAVARIFWSVLWQAALVSPGGKDFYRFAEETKATAYMRLLRGYPDRKVRTLRRLFLLSRGLYYRTVRLLGGRYTLLEKVPAEVLEEAARVCPDPGEAPA